MELRRGRLARSRGLLLALAAGAVVAGCSSNTHHTSETTQTTVAPGGPVFAQGGVVTVAVPYLPTNFNPSTPAGSNRVTQMVMQQVLPQALVIDPDYAPETTGMIDQAEVVSLRPMQVEYQIDPRAIWSDGVEITAADFIYNWHEQLENASQLPVAGPIVGYRAIRTIVASNRGKTVTVTFSHPYADWESLFANLIPAHIAESAGWSSAFQGFHRDDVVSGGPFEISSFEPGKQLVLSRNPRYWGTPAHLDRIVLVVSHSKQATLARLEQGTLSLAEVAPGDDVTAAVAHADAAGNELSATTSSSTTLWQLLFNLHATAVDQLAMRQALADSTDRAELVADSIGLDAPLTVPTASRLFGDGQPGAGLVATQATVYSPVRASALFASLGYSKGTDGYLRLGGTGAILTLDLVGPSDSVEMARLEAQLQAEWTAAGIRLVYSNVPLAHLLNTVLPKGEYQVALAPYQVPAFPTWNALLYTNSVLPTSTTPKPPATSTRSTTTTVPSGSTASTTPTGSSTTTTTLGGQIGATTPAYPWSVPTPVGTQPGAAALGVVTRNVTGLANLHVAIRFQELVAELNASHSEQLLAKLDALLWHEMPTIPLFLVPVTVVQQANLVNVSESPTWAGLFWDAQDWAIQLSPPPTTLAG